MNPAMLPANSDAVVIHDLEFRWNKHKPILQIPYLQLQRGENIFIKGASGSGKSTLLSLIGGVVKPHAGTLTVLGQPMHQLGSAQRDRFRAEYIGFIFQMFNLIPYLTVLENVLLPCRFSTRRRARIEAQQRSLDDEAVRLLNCLDLPSSLLTRPVTDLSVGQQQRVAAARALIGQPELVIADEPTSALDNDRRSVFLRLLLQECQARQTTLIFVSHDMTLQHHFERHVDLAQLNEATRSMD